MGVYNTPSRNIAALVTWGKIHPYSGTGVTECRAACCCHANGLFPRQAGGTMYPTNDDKDILMESDLTFWHILLSDDRRSCATYGPTSCLAYDKLRSRLIMACST